MLVLSRKIGEIVTIGSSIKITVLGFDRGVVRLGIEAPKSVPVHRKEVYDNIIEENRKAAKSEVEDLKKALGEFSLKPATQPSVNNSLPKIDTAKITDAREDSE